MATLMHLPSKPGTFPQTGPEWVRSTAVQNFASRLAGIQGLILALHMTRSARYASTAGDFNR